MNVIVLEEKDGITDLKIDGTQIKFIKDYSIKKTSEEKDLLELTLTIMIDPNKSKIALT